MSESLGQESPCVYAGEDVNQDEYQQLVLMSDRLEELNVQRIQSLIQLAKHRQQTLPELMENFGIKGAKVVSIYA
jgi:hypothetical protein